ncbi:MAG: TetR/AcrR family transcriptional regulator [Bacteroidota bacterium]
MGYKHDKSAIIAQGVELIRKNGYHNVGINLILKTMEIPKGSFYNFFDSKEAFGEEILNHYGERSLKMIKSYLDKPAPSPLLRLQEFYRMLINSNESDGMDAGCLVNNMLIELGGINERLGKVADRNFEIWLDTIATCIKEGQMKDEIIAHVPARDLAEFLHAGLYGAFARMKAKRDRVYLDKWYTMSFEYIRQ